MRRLLFMGVFVLSAACGGAMDATVEGDLSLETLKQRLSLFDYSASNTNYAQDTSTSAQSGISLAAGETVMIGTCGITDSAYTGDTYLRLYSPSSTQVAVSDDACGLGSKIAYTAPSAGTYTLRAGCFSTGNCTGTVALSRRKAAYAIPNLSNTNNATINTFNKQYYFNGGEILRVSTCAANASGATASGDTILRLFQQSNGAYTNEVASNDNAGGSCASASEIIYSVPAAGYYQIRAGCAANTACSATVAVYTE